MLNGSQATTLLQIFCELSLNSQVIFKSMRVADELWFELSCMYVCVYFVWMNDKLYSADIVKYKWILPSTN